MFRQKSSYDLVVIGSGSGALVAAIAAHEAGLSVAIFEKAAVVGGGTAFSGGVVWAPCNHIMRRKGMEDSVEDALTYLRGASQNRGDEDIQRSYVENVGPLIERVEEWTGLRWIIWGGQPDYYPEIPGARLDGRAILPHPAASHDLLAPHEAELPELALVRQTPHMDFVPGFQRSDRLPRDSWLAGRSIIGGLWKAVLDRQIPYFLSTPARTLITDNGRVTGVVVEPPGGGSLRVTARRGVLLNTGGFDWNEEFAKRYLPVAAAPQTPPSNTGDGHVMAMALGAATALMDKAVLHPAIVIPGDLQENGMPLYRMFNLEMSKPHCVLVNQRGTRFATETAHFAVVDAWGKVDLHTRQLANLPCYLICDATYREKYGLPGVRAADSVPDWISQAVSLDSLAAQLRLDAEALAQEIETYNKDCVDGIDTRFDRGSTAYERFWGDPEHGPNPTMGPIGEAPFYGFPIHFAHSGTRGGVVTTSDARVVSVTDDIIPGLYACGNTAANLLFGGGYGSGSAVGSSMVFGYLAAMHAAGCESSA